MKRFHHFRSLCNSNVYVLTKCFGANTEYRHMSTCQEREVIQAIQRQLQQKIDESFEQLCVLQEARQQILADLQDKNIAHDIDVEQYNLTENSSNISYKPNPTRVPKGSVELKLLSPGM